MQGAPPLASPGLNPGGTGKGGKPRARRVACILCRLLPPAFTFFPAPIPPFPAGKGEPKVISCKGLRPLHPRGLNPGDTCTTKGFCLFTGGSAGSQGEGGPGERNFGV